MKSYFADTSFFVAFLNSRDEFHEQAVDYIRQTSHFLITTEWVVVELGNYLSKTRMRRRFVPFVRDLIADPLVHVEMTMAGVVDLTLDLYHHRPDKHWSMTDCLSFLVMQDRGLREALTTDHHFAQAGFKVLLK